MSFVIVRKLDFMSHSNITYYAYYEYVYIKVINTHIYIYEYFIPFITVCYIQRYYLII